MAAAERHGVRLVWIKLCGSLAISKIKAQRQPEVVWDLFDAWAIDDHFRLIWEGMPWVCVQCDRRCYFRMEDKG